MAQRADAPESRLASARTLARVSMVLSVIFFVVCIIATVIAAMGSANSLADIDPSSVEQEESVASFLAMIAVFCGSGALFGAVTFLTGLSIVRASNNEDHIYRSVAAAVVGGVCAIVCLRIVTAICLWVSAAKLNRYAADTQGDEYFKGGKRLGLMRLVEFVCVLSLVSSVVVLVFVTRSGMYDSAYWVSFIKMLLMAVTLWLLWNRKQHGREIIIAMVAGYLVLSMVVSIATGTFGFAAYIGSSIFPIILLLYFIFSKRAKAVFNTPFKRLSRAEQLKEDEKLWNPKSLKFWRNLLLYFCIFSVVGHWMEWSVCWLIRWGLVPGEYDPNSGIWHDMLNPFFVYGAAMVIIGLVLFPFKNWLQAKISNRWLPVILSFVANTLFCCAIEFAMGMMLNYPPDPVTGKLPLWDYSNMAFNFMGQVCLLNTLFFGVVATFMTWIVYPNLEKLFARLPDDVMNIVTVVVLVFFVLVVAMYVINLADPDMTEVLFGEEGLVL